MRKVTVKKDSIVEDIFFLEGWLYTKYSRGCLVNFDMKENDKAVSICGFKHENTNILDVTRRAIERGANVAITRDLYNEFVNGGKQFDAFRTDVVQYHYGYLVPFEKGSVWHMHLYLDCVFFLKTFKHLVKEIRFVRKTACFHLDIPNNNFGGVFKMRQHDFQRYFS
jgi:hypothetical protein